jgi:hypothetical protein
MKCAHDFRAKLSWGTVTYETERKKWFKMKTDLREVVMSIGGGVANNGL